MATLRDQSMPLHEGITVDRDGDVDGHTDWSSRRLSVQQFLLLLEAHINISNKVLSTLEYSIFSGHKSGIWHSGPQIHCPTVRFLHSELAFKVENPDFRMWSSGR